ncbi:hypothetical protein H3V11_09010 [Snodgrassella sp. W8158]|uniref:hypothetical protein n=1 Tax=Snodgrassella sp. W8158 TaxID=2751018 RepID=UPI0018DBFE65|nr:hypothetical protein [Snodgrassella sp. W8158]MBI0182077.1 hypothetical protein [Snodgrassella sp. W8158]
MPGFLNFLLIVLMIVLFISLFGLLCTVIANVISEAELSDIFSWRFQKRKGYIVADDSLCDMLEIILSDLDKYKPCISYTPYCLYIRPDNGYKSIIVDYSDGLTVISPEEIKFPKSREKDLKKLIKKALVFFEESDTNKKLTRVKNSLSSALNPTTNQHKTPEVLDIDE